MYTAKPYYTSSRSHLYYKTDAKELFLLKTTRIEFSTLRKKKYDLIHFGTTSGWHEVFAAIVEILL